MSEFWPSMAGKFRDWPPTDEIAAVRAEWDLFALLDREHDQGMILPLYPEPGGAVSWGEPQAGTRFAGRLTEPILTDGWWWPSARVPACPASA